jgi:transcriptional regulator with XRE-family HTH domain
MGWKMAAKTRFLKQLRDLDRRRKNLGMSRAVVAKRSGIPLVTVERILSGREARPGMPSVLAIAEALGIPWTFDVRHGIDEMRERQARHKAKRLVALVQGTSGLEGQAVDADELRRMENQTALELLAGSNRRLWGD